MANCGYVTAEGETGKGIARRMCEHSLDHARMRGFSAMQFNLVIETNERAVRLWQSLGFEIAGRLPGAFHHPRRGYVDAPSSCSAPSSVARDRRPIGTARTPAFMRVTERLDLGRACVRRSH